MPSDWKFLAIEKDENETNDAECREKKDRMFGKQEEKQQETTTTTT